MSGRQPEGVSCYTALILLVVAAVAIGVAVWTIWPKR